MRRSHSLRALGQLRRSHLVHRHDDHRKDVEAVEADLRTRGTLIVGCAHVYAHVAYFGWVASLGSEVCGELQHRLSGRVPLLRTAAAWYSAHARR